MLNAFKKFIKSQNLLDDKRHCLIAVSGGVDSVVLTDLMHRAGIPFAMAHMNFKLRGRDSEEDMRFVKALAKKYKVPCHIKEHALKQKGNKGGSVQMAARDARYEWFRELAGKHHYDRIATAHHQDDQLETVLLNLTKGTGLAGLHGILPHHDHLIRPLLFASRKDIEKYARQRKLKFREDASNLDKKYQRNLIRHDVIPALRKINPSVEQTMASNIERFRQAEAIVKDTLRVFREEVLKQDREDHFIERWCLTPRPGLALMMAEVLKPFGFGEDEATYLIGKEKLRTGHTLTSASHQLVVGHDRIVIRKKETDKKATSDWSFEGKTCETPVGRLLMNRLKKPPANLKTQRHFIYVDEDQLNGHLHIRYWKKGDAFKPLGMKGKKKLSDFFTEQKVHRLDRDRIPLLFAGNKLIWVIGYRMADHVKVTGKTTGVIRFTWKPNP
ncbi:MAG: tRNA lysidine(34) synthetase TilS [Flavobacteriales bacterium]|nr:tRNA lysidine(34) synthetase TilS [Flavobacteriales bacterium]